MGGILYKYIVKKLF